MGAKKEKEMALAARNEDEVMDEAVLFERVSAIIENRKHRMQAVVNSEATLMFWEVGQYIHSGILGNKRTLDILGLKENYLEADLEKAILVDLEAFILEFGQGFTFVERQKRMIIGDEEVRLDLLFYNRNVHRLVAVELKLGQFKAAYKGQMELYLNWLDRYERREGEEAPIGIILCASANREKIELLNMDSAGIAVAEYWTELPPKDVFEQKIKEITYEAHERLERRKLFSDGRKTRIDYFWDVKEDKEEKDF